jgi:hypothetical protein
VNRTRTLFLVGVLAVAITVSVGAARAAKAPPKLKAAVNANGTVSLRDARDRVVTTLKPGWYTITIADDSRTLDFHIVGPGVNHSTGIRFRGVELWGLRVRKGVYRIESDPGARHGRMFTVA